MLYNLLFVLIVKLFLKEQMLLTQESLSENMEAVRRKFEVNKTDCLALSVHIYYHNI